MPPQMRAWNQASGHGAGPSKLPEETSDELKALRMPVTHASLKEPVGLPGFHNSFVTSSPIQPLSLAKKGKENERQNDGFGWVDSVSQPRPMTRENRIHPRSPPSSPIWSRGALPG